MTLSDKATTRMGCMHRLGLVLVWATLASLATFATWQVVSSAESQVSQDPVAPVIALSTPTTSLNSGPAPTESTRPSSNPTSTGAPSTVTTTATTSRSTSTTTAGQTTSTTTAGQITLIPSIGGSVTVRHSGDQVILVAASPALGFEVEIENGGPDEVEVDFEQTIGSLKIDIRARVKDGQLVTEVIESIGTDD